MPLVDATHVGYTVVLVVVSLVIVRLEAFVEFVDDVDVVALPVKAPTNVVDVTEANPVKVVMVLPRETEIFPRVNKPLLQAPSPRKYVDTVGVPVPSCATGNIPEVMSEVVWAWDSDAAPISDNTWDGVRCCNVVLVAAFK